MSIQDKIFDIENELENLNASDETKQDFDDIITYLGNLERSLEDYAAFYKAAVDLKLAIKKLEKKSK